MRPTMSDRTGTFPGAGGGGGGGGGRGKSKVDDGSKRGGGLPPLSPSSSSDGENSCEQVNWQLTINQFGEKRSLYNNCFWLDGSIYSSR